MLSLAAVDRREQRRWVHLAVRDLSLFRFARVIARGPRRYWVRPEVRGVVSYSAFPIRHCPHLGIPATLRLDAGCGARDRDDRVFLAKLGQTDHVPSKFALGSPSGLSRAGRRIFRSSALARPWGRRLESQLREGALDDNECQVRWSARVSGRSNPLADNRFDSRGLPRLSM